MWVGNIWCKYSVWSDIGHRVGSFLPTTADTVVGMVDCNAVFTGSRGYGIYAPECSVRILVIRARVLRG